MMKWTLIALVLILAACDHPTAPPQPEAERKPNSVFESQIQALQKAHTVENQAQDAAEAQRRQLDEATRQ